MASICEALLDTAGTAQLSRKFETRVRWLERRKDHWLLENEDRTWSSGPSALCSVEPCWPIPAH